MTPAGLATDAALVLAGYLLGAIPFGVIVGWWRRGIDVSRYGSGSTGATNVLRTMGWRASAVVFLGDMLKSAVAVLLARLIVDSASVAALAGVAAIAGHCWSIYIGGKGGRGVTSTFGATLILQPFVALGSLAVAIGVMAGTRFASLGSLCGVGFGTLAMAYLLITQHVPPAYLIFTIGAPLIVYVRHRDNIGRLVRGRERKIGQKAPGV
ncbi:MAG TPA: glycerol-3-phosphate 1-O-acyltransferase PlsY [Chloroflexota bacterium]|nr:glycerol-3-phosphate 1-O-acyltransferase PlsY [Chloroflexota bacterium]